MTERTERTLVQKKNETKTIQTEKMFKYRKLINHRKTKHNKKLFKWLENK